MHAGWMMGKCIPIAWASIGQALTANRWEPIRVAHHVLLKTSRPQHEDIHDTLALHLELPGVGFGDAPAKCWSGTTNSSSMRRKPPTASQERTAAKRVQKISLVTRFLTGKLHLRCRDQAGLRRDGSVLSLFATVRGRGHTMHTEFLFGSRGFDGHQDLGRPVRPAQS